MPPLAALALVTRALRPGSRDPAGGRDSSRAGPGRPALTPPRPGPAGSQTPAHSASLPPPPRHYSAPEAAPSPAPARPGDGGRASLLVHLVAHRPQRRLRSDSASGRVCIYQDPWRQGPQSGGSGLRASRLRAGRGRTEPDLPQGPQKGNLPACGPPPSHSSFPLPCDRKHAGAAPALLFYFNHQILNFLLLTASLVKNMKE